MVEDKKQEEEQKDEYSVVQIPTQLGLAIQTPEGKVLNIDSESLTEILNKLYVIEKALSTLVKA